MLNLRRCSLLIGTSFLSLLASSSLRADLLWYSGDPTTTYLHGNVVGLDPDTFLGVPITQMPFEDFIVDSPTGWSVGGLFSNNLVFATAPAFTTAQWSIRTGVSTSSLGTVVAGGISPASIAYNGLDFTEPTLNLEFRGATITVSGLDVHLDPGSYWLQVSPIYAQGLTYVPTSFGSVGVSSSLVVSTDGSGSIGSPVGNNNMLAYTSNDNLIFQYRLNGSFGILSGTAAVPEPGSIALLLGMGSVSIGLLARRRRQRIR